MEVGDDHASCLSSPAGQGGIGVGVRFIGEC